MSDGSTSTSVSACAMRTGGKARPPRVGTQRSGAACRECEPAPRPAGGPAGIGAGPFPAAPASALHPGFAGIEVRTHHAKWPAAVPATGGRPRERQGASTRRGHPGPGRSAAAGRTGRIDCRIAARRRPGDGVGISAPTPPSTNSSAPSARNPRPTTRVVPQTPLRAQVDQAHT